MREVKEAKGVKDAEEVKERSGGVAAFFDLDGTLAALPSMEKRFFGELRRSGRIPFRNYFLWMAEALRLARRGIGPMLQANKMYLRGVKSFPMEGDGDGGEIDFCWSEASGRNGAAEQEHGKKQVRLPVPQFFEQAMERVEWHARQGHKIFLVSGTLEPLASCAAIALAVRLGVQGIHTKIGVCATRPEEMNGRYTGQITGEAMFGETKAQAVRQIATEMGCALEKCYAYGDSASDRWMLVAVGRATAVNPSKELERVARLHGWPVMRWSGKKKETQKCSGERIVLESLG